MNLSFRCPFCPDYYWDPRELIKHRNLHTNIQYTCEICCQKFTSRENFYGHCTSHLTKRKSDPGEKFTCDICNKHFKTKGSIRNHMLLHTGNTIFCVLFLVFLCLNNNCFFTLADKYDHVCEQCGWKFQSKGNLKGHLASTHASAKPFKCDQCSRWYINIFILHLFC